MKLKVLLEGGFHNSPEIRFVLNIDKKYSDMSADELFYHYATEHQKNRAKRHFCGINGCLCGAYVKATFSKVKN